MNLPTNELTWAALLGQWIDFARSALALPDDEPGQRMRESVSDLIMLQAVWFSLQHLDELEPDEKAIGLDRAELLIDKHTQILQKRWGSEVMPPLIGELIDDARQAAAASARNLIDDVDPG